jgi:hypothetical protein
MKTASFPFRILLLIAAIIFFASCKKEKDAELPDISFKTGSSYISTNTTLGKSEIVTVGIAADKKNADLMTFKVYQSGANSSFSLQNTYNVSNDEKDHYEKDYKITTDTASGSENWKFEISDKNGNVNSVELKLTIH